MVALVRQYVHGSVIERARRLGTHGLQALQRRLEFLCRNGLVERLYKSPAIAGLLRFWGLVIPGYLGSWSNSKGQEHRPEWEGTDFQLIQWIERVRAASSVAVDHVAAGYGNVDLAGGCLD